MVVTEDLNVGGMVKNRRLARAVSDQGFGQARRMLGYKTEWNGGNLVVTDRWFPSSKTCSGCGAVKAKCRCTSGSTTASTAAGPGPGCERRR